jgi:hypothetical protein
VRGGAREAFGKNRQRGASARQQVGRQVDLGVVGEHAERAGWVGPVELVGVGADGVVRVLARRVVLAHPLDAVEDVARHLGGDVGVPRAPAAATHPPAAGQSLSERAFKTSTAAVKACVYCCCMGSPRATGFERRVRPHARLLIVVVELVVFVVAGVRTTGRARRHRRLHAREDRRVALGELAALRLARSITRSRKSFGSSVSNATTKSWSSRPKLYVVLSFTLGYLLPP